MLSVKVCIVTAAVKSVLGLTLAGALDGRFTMLEFKPDAEDAFCRTEAWWRGELIDRVSLAIVATKPGGPPALAAEPATLEERWTDINYVIESGLARLRRHVFLGEALPALRAGLGPNFLAATLGGALRFMDDTTWIESCIADWETFAGFPDYRQNRWYRLTVSMIEALAAAAKGRFIAQMPDLHANGDALAALRGNEAFLMDFYDHPDRVRQALDHLNTVNNEMVDTFFRLTTAHGQRGSTGFLVWGPGKTFPIQDDTLALVSPATAREFLLPGLRRQARHVDHALMHLDGPEALDKLDLLLDCPEIHGIQWQPGAAHREMTQWIPLMQRILGAGKLLYIGCQPRELEPILRAVPSRGLRIGMNVAGEDTGRRLLELAARLTH